MKRNREFAATPIPHQNLDFVRTKTFSCQKSFVTRNIKILRGNRGGGVFLVPFHCKKIKYKPIRRRVKCQLYFVPERICWDKIKLTAEVPKVDRNIRSGKKVSRSGIQGGNGSPIAEFRKLGGKGELFFPTGTARGCAYGSPRAKPLVLYGAPHTPTGLCVRFRT